uniref:Lupus La protein n=1 Tax=Steinernema glaseri TaxID=37863 RepID=A0A1I7Z471_9BILA
MAKMTVCVSQTCLPDKFPSFQEVVGNMERGDTCLEEEHLSPKSLLRFFEIVHQLGDWSWRESSDYRMGRRAASPVSAMLLSKRCDAPAGGWDIKRFTMAGEDKAAQIRRQVEYYFGDINLPRDKFLQDCLKEDEGWVTLDTMLKFKRLAQISSDKEEIAQALATSELIDVSDDNTKIRRSADIPVPENSLEYWQTIKNRTVYVKGFEEDAKLDDLLQFFTESGNVDNVLMRRAKPSKTFKGSVFVTFKTDEEAKVFVENDVKEYKGKELTKMMQNDFWQKNAQESKERRQNERAAKNAKRNAVDAERAKSQVLAQFTKGLILDIDGLPTDAALNDVKNFFRQFGDVGYVVYEAGQSKAQIRFGGDEDGAKQAWEKAVAQGTDGKVLYKEAEITAKVLEGDEEAQYWVEFNKQKATKRDRHDNSKRGGRGGRGGRGRGGFRGDRGRNNDRNVEKAEKKATKTVFTEEAEAAPAPEKAAEAAPEKPASPAQKRPHEGGEETEAKKAKIDE